MTVFAQPLPANATSWVPNASDSQFSIHNLPLGVFSSKGNENKRVGVAIGPYVLDLVAIAEAGLFQKQSFPAASTFAQPSINAFMELGRPVWTTFRQRLQEILLDGNQSLASNEALLKTVLIPLDEVTLHMPVQVGDYTDFYSSRAHATNVGTMFRDPNNALLPNWLHLPVAYHGRASSILPSGQPIHRPKGQQKPADADAPIFGPCKLLDFELEMAFIIGKPNELAHSISTTQAPEHIFGFVIFNDWSARDIQTWEYQPLGPFLSKNFASSISPWVVMIDALEPFKVQGETQSPEVLPYLATSGPQHYNIELEVYIEAPGQAPQLICQSNYKNLYWSVAQQLAHHTVNGCNMRVGDMCASGTISGNEPSSFGSMLELTWRGTKPIKMADGSERKFINDGDTVIMRAFAEREGRKIGFGEVRTTVLPAV